MKKKSWGEKLRDGKDLPKIEKLSPEIAKRWGGSTMVIPSPLEVDGIMKEVPKGKVITINEIRKRLALKHGTDIACPLTTGIFSWISAHAAEEEKAGGKKRITPWWRTLKTGGELNPKYPGGFQIQMELLEAEGHRVVPKGKKSFKMLDFEKSIVKV